MTHYEVLGVSDDATAAELRRAYLRLARDHHPDRHAEGAPADLARAETEMQRLNEAWAALGDEAARARYDRDLASARRAAWTPGTASPDFVPIDDGVDPEDPAAEHDVPYGDGSPVHRSLQVGPALTFAVALLALGSGALLDFRPLLALGVAGLVATALGFLAAPAYAVLRSNHTSREP